MEEQPKTGIIEKIFQPIKFIVYSIAGISIIMVTYYAVRDGGFHSTKSNDVTADAESQYAEAIIVVQNEAKERLKSPSTARFPLPNYVNRSYLGNGTFEVNGYVDAQNGFGAVVRSNYSARVTKTGPGQFDWTVENLTIE